MCVEMELLRIKHRNKTADLVQEYYSYRDRRYKEYLQLFTDSNYPRTDEIGAVVIHQTTVSLYHQTGVSRRTSD